jgi:hypothetical protein
MQNKILTAGALAGVLMLPVAAYAQSGVAAGVTTGAVGGAVVGGIADASRPQFRTYVVEQHVPSYAYSSQVVVGAELLEQGITYYEVPPQYGVTQYRYTVVNNRTVLVEPRTRRVVQVIE